nr:alpha/beta hydrolase [Streptomyces boncukensis]
MPGTGTGADGAPSGDAAPPRVYLHGLGASSAPYFASCAAHSRLAAGGRALLLDLLGFGYTLEEHADAVAAALEAAGVRGADVIAHSMGGSVALVLAVRHPRLVGRLVLVDANLDPVEPVRGAWGSSGIAAWTEEEFLAGGWREALYRSAVLPQLPLGGAPMARGTVPALPSAPTLRALLLDLPLPRTFLRPEADGPVRGEDELTARGVAVVPVPGCGHNNMLDNPEGFVRAVAEGLRDVSAPGDRAAASPPRRPDGPPAR